jgi:uncharacterized protein (DUF1800 family)
VIDLTLDNPAKGDICARYMVTKFWKFFANTSPDAAVVTALANIFKASWDIKATIRALLLLPEFYASNVKQQLVRSPVELRAAASKNTGVAAATARPDNYHVNMNQELLNPPDVSGWKQNAYWISSASYWARAAFAKNIANKAKDANLLSGIAVMSVPAAVQTTLDTFGITNPAAATVTAMQNYLAAAINANDSVDTRRVNLMVLAILSPDFNLA